MTKDDFKKKIDEAGDAVITYKGQGNKNTIYVLEISLRSIYKKRKLVQRKTLPQCFCFVGILTLIDYLNLKV